VQCTHDLLRLQLLSCISACQLLQSPLKRWEEVGMTAEIVFTAAAL